MDQRWSVGRERGGEGRLECRSRIDEARTPAVGHSQRKLFHFFATLMMVLNCLNSYRGFPFKQDLLTNYLLVAYKLFLLAVILFNVFLESLLSGPFLASYIGFIRVPVYQAAQLSQFFLLSALMGVAFGFISHVIQKIILYRNARLIRTQNRQVLTDKEVDVKA